ncbi:MAG: M20/M25/M40 family metallo-hydrolase [Chloroflexota bacterium]|nr:M20/M25/M40 family metallo-hydrolase [Chloroflexota bacterium]
MTSALFDLIKTLSELPGPVGQENAVLDYVEQLWREVGADTERTAIGNVLARAGGRGRKLLLVGHADELCYLVRDIAPGGFLWLANGQGWERSTSLRNWFTVGQRVQVLARSGALPGVIAAVTGHIATLTLGEPHELTWHDFWVDTGLSRQELLERGVTPGTRVVWNAETIQLGPHVVGKALDDRVPLAVITEVLRRVPREERAWDLTLACTVQEEVEVIGASALAARARFDAAIAVEIGLAGDMPGVVDHAMPVRLGAGPVLVHKDALVHYDYALTRALEQAAGDAGIALQHAVFGSIGSDGAAFMRADVPSALVAFPTRYTHSPFETGHLGDIEALITWLCAFVRGHPGGSGSQES